MVRLEYWNGEQWIFVDKYPSDKMAWIALGGDNYNYRTVDIFTGIVLTDNSENDEQ